MSFLEDERIYKKPNIYFNDSSAIINETQILSELQSTVDCLKIDLSDMERYFVNKILYYKNDFESNIAKLERELEDSKLAHLNVLKKIKFQKDRIIELESKNDFYKKRLSKFECDN